MVLVHISRSSRFVLGVVVHELARNLVVLDFLVVVPYSSVLEAPEGVERVSFHVSVHHVSLRVVVCGDKILGSDILDHLVVVGEGELRCPGEVPLEDVLGLDREFKTLVGCSSEVLPV